MNVQIQWKVNAEMVSIGVRFAYDSRPLFCYFSDLSVVQRKYLLIKSLKTVFERKLFETTKILYRYLHQIQRRYNNRN